MDLQHRDATRFHKFMVGMKEASHIFCFDKAFRDELLEKLMQILNNTKFKVFVSSWPQRKLERLGLRRCLCAAQFKANIGGSAYEMYIYVKESQASPHSSKPNSPQVQQVKVEKQSSARKSSPAAEEKVTKVEAKQPSTQAGTQAVAPPKASAIKEEKHTEVKEEVKQTPGRADHDSLIGKRSVGTPNFGDIRTDHGEKRPCLDPAISLSSSVVHLKIVDSIKRVIEQFRSMKLEHYDKTYRSLKAMQSNEKEWTSFSSQLKAFIYDQVVGIRHNYIKEDQSCAYLCQGDSERYNGNYVILKYYPGNTIDLKKAELDRRSELVKAVNAENISFLLLDDSISASIDDKSKQAAVLKTLHTGNLEELLEQTDLQIPIVLLKYYFRMLARMLEHTHFAGFCHWGIYNNKVKLTPKLLPVVRNVGKLHNVNSFLHGGPKCRYRLPPLYTADLREGHITSANKKAIDNYMLGVLIYRALLGVPYPYGRQDSSYYGTEQYNFTELAIDFSTERLEVMGWTLEEVEGSRTLLEGLLQVDPARQMKAKEVVAHSWLARDPALH